MPLRADPKYPSRRAYVVKLRGDTTPPALAGRIENLVTGRQLEFTSGGELLDSLARDLLEHVIEQSAELSRAER
jgi:hypothetical protein